jgi:acetylornithine deacetylase/succinyl-diaminopimelate desuccinylase-like protein
MTEVPPQWLEELFSWLRIPSVSADPAHAGEVRRAAEWVCDLVRRAGGNCDVVDLDGQPLVVGEVAASNGSADAPTILVYGHFDVQPAGALELWDSDPFDPEIRDGWIYGRGAADDKGNAYLVLKAVEQLASEGALPVNVRIVCDGEEETGGNTIVRFITSDERGADAALIFDGEMVKVDVPALYVGTRGIIYYHVHVRTGRRDLHSGLFGGAALNALHALTETLSAVTRIPPELREGVGPVAPEEVESWKQLEPGESVLAAQGATPKDDHAAGEFYMRTLAAPSVDINGIVGGEARFQKTVIPVEADANVSIRLAPGQEVDAIGAVFERLLHDAAPAGAELTVTRMSSSDGSLVEPSTPAVKLAMDAFERAAGKRPVLVRSGGSLPIVSALAARGVPTVLTGFDVPEGNIHAPNERLLVRYVALGVTVARELLQSMTKLPVLR